MCIVHPSSLKYFQFAWNYSRPLVHNPLICNHLYPLLLLLARMLRSPRQAGDYCLFGLKEEHIFWIGASELLGKWKKRVANDSHYLRVIHYFMIPQHRLWHKGILSFCGNMQYQEGREIDPPLNIPITFSFDSNLSARLSVYYSCVQPTGHKFVRYFHGIWYIYTLRIKD